MRALLLPIAAVLLIVVSSTSAAASGATVSLAVSSGSGLLVSATPTNLETSVAGAGADAYLPIVPITVADTRGTGSGWHVTVQATVLGCAVGPNGCESAQNSLPSGSLIMAAPHVACVPGCECAARAAPPEITVGGAVPIDGGTAVTVASAQPETGMGSYVLTPGTLDGIDGHALHLAVPPDTPPGTYEPVITISILSGPA